jgi:hypothetical protein
LLDSQGPPLVTIGDSLVNSTITTKMVMTDPEFFKTYGIEMAAGRDFSKSIPTDDSLAFIINETAANMYGWKNIGDGLDKDFSYGGTKGKLIGVVKDFHFESLHQPIIPLVFFERKQSYNDLSVKIAGNQITQGLEHIEKVWKEFLPKRPFSYQFVSDDYRRLYEEEQKQSQLFTMFSGISNFHCVFGTIWTCHIQHTTARERNRNSESIGCLRAQYFRIALKRNCDPYFSGQPDRLAPRVVLYGSMACFLRVPHRYESGASTSFRLLLRLYWR